jgi:hypothetical protein
LFAAEGHVPSYVMSHQRHFQTSGVKHEALYREVGNLPEHHHDKSACWIFHMLFVFRNLIFILYFVALMCVIGCSGSKNPPNINSLLSDVPLGLKFILSALNEGWVEGENNSVEMATLRSNFQLESLHSEILIRAFIQSVNYPNKSSHTFSLVGETDQPYLYQLAESSFLSHRITPHFPETHELSLWTVTIAYCMNGSKHSVSDGCVDDFNSVPFSKKFQFGLETRFKIQNHRDPHASIPEQIRDWRRSIINLENDRILGI